MTAAAPDTATTPALPDPTETWAARLAAVPGGTARWAAQFHGALVSPRGTCGETGDAWIYDPDRGWMHHDGYRLTPVGTPAAPGGPPAPAPPDDVEVVDWPGNGHREGVLNAGLAAFAESEYRALAAWAAECGETAAFRAAAALTGRAQP